MNLFPSYKKKGFLLVAGPEVPTNPLTSTKPVFFWSSKGTTLTGPL